MWFQKIKWMPSLIPVLLVAVGSAGFSGCATMATPYTQARGYHSAGRMDEAIAMYFQALEEEPNRVEIQLGLAEALAAKGMREDALHALERARKLAPQDTQIQQRLGQAYFEQGQWLQKSGKTSDAYEAWQKTLKCIPSHSAAQAAIKALYPEKENKLLTVEPGTSEAERYRVQGMLDFNQGRYEAALAGFQQALRLEPKDATTCNNIGNVYLKTGQMDEAQASFEQAIGLDPNQAVIHANLGTVFFQVGRYQSARAEWETALQLDSASATVQQNLETLDQLGY